MKNTKLIICLNRAVAMGFMTRSTADELIAMLIIINNR
jgi:hypothetical protein